MAKRTTVLAFFLITFASLLQAQMVKHPFPTNNAYWHTSLGCVEPYYEEIYTCLDTVLDGKAYSQIYNSFYAFNGPSPGYYAGGLRSENDKVWFKPSTSSDELLIYDFSAQAGDTVHLWRNYVIWATPELDTLENVTFIVTKVDSVLLHDGWHKRWKARCYNGYYAFETWIEGLGSTNGVFDRYICGIFGSVAKVNCFWHNGQTEYSYAPGVSCDNIAFPGCLVSTSTSQPLPLGVSISPNPFTDVLTISFSGEISASTQVKLYDILGNAVEFHSQKVGNTLRLERKNLPHGIYFLNIEQAGKRQNFKLLAE